MKLSTLYKITIKIYEELYRQATLRKNYTFRCNANDLKMLIKFMHWFIDAYPKSQSTAILIQYFEFQFSHYAGIVTQYGKNSIMLSWLVGTKAQKRWMERDLTKHWLVGMKLRKEVNLKLFHAFEDDILVDIMKKKRERAIQLYDYEEKEKQRFFNTDKGFIYCMTVTTLYKPNSKWCEGCNFKDLCEKTLFNNFPKIYEVRCQTNKNLNQ